MLDSAEGSQACLTPGLPLSCISHSCTLACRASLLHVFRCSLLRLSCASLVQVTIARVIGVAYTTFLCIFACIGACLCYPDPHNCDVSVSRALAALCAQALHGPCRRAVCRSQCNDQRRLLKRLLSACPERLLALPGQRLSQKLTWQCAGLIPCCILRAVAGPGVGIISNLGFGIPIIAGQFMTVSLQAFWTHVSSAIPWPCDCGYADRLSTA